MLKITHLHKTFFPNTPNEKKALRGVSLTLEEGDFVTVIGSNGSGKSTLMNCIAGVFYPDKGHILIDGVDVTRMPEHVRAKYIGRVFQDPMKGTAGDMQVAENLAMASRRGKPLSLKWSSKSSQLTEFKEAIPILDKKTHFLFHLSPTNLKHSIHRCFSGERFVLQPITASITYHLSPSTLNPRLLYPQLTCYSLFHYLKQRVSRRETKCFTPRNQVFHALELIVSSNRNFSFPPLKL